MCPILSGGLSAVPHKSSTEPSSGEEVSSVSGESGVLSPADSEQNTRGKTDHKVVKIMSPEPELSDASSQAEECEKKSLQGTSDDHLSDNVS